MIAEFEICVRAAGDCFRQAHARDQCDAQRDRHVHVGAALAQGGQRGGEERPARIGNRRHRDQRGNPMQQPDGRRADAVRHAAALAGPDADRDQHHVTRGEPGDGQGSQQRPPGAVLRGCQSRGVEWHQAISQRLDPCDQAVSVFGRAAPRQAQTAGGHVDTARQYARFLRQHLFDQPDAGAAQQTVDGERQLLGAISSADDVPAQIPALGRFRLGWPCPGQQRPLTIIAPKAKTLNDVIGRRTAGAAEAAPQRRRQPTMRTKRLGGGAGWRQRQSNRRAHGGPGGISGRSPAASCCRSGHPRAP